MIQEMTRGGRESRKTTFHEINRSSRRRLNWTFLRFTFMSPFVVNERISLSAWNQCELWHFLQTTLFLFRLFFPSSVMSLLKLPIIKLLLKFQKISDIEKYFSSLFLSKTKERDESSGAMRWGSTAQHTEVLSIESRKSNENRYWTAFHWELRVGEFYEISISIIVSLSFLPLIHVRIAITIIQKKSSRWETDTKHWKHKCTIAMIEENEILRNPDDERESSTQSEKHERSEKWTDLVPSVVGEAHFMWWWYYCGKSQPFFVGKSEIIDFLSLWFSPIHLNTYSCTHSNSNHSGPSR